MTTPMFGCSVVLTATMDDVDDGRMWLNDVPWVSHCQFTLVVVIVVVVDCILKEVLCTSSSSRWNKNRLVVLQYPSWTDW